MNLSDENIVKIPSIPTGSLSLDIALGIGGLPKGRVIEIYGPESSGKTTLSMHCIAEAQKQGGIAAFIDAEHAFDKTYAEKMIEKENVKLSGKVVTKTSLVKNYCPAEEYHQRYLEKR